MEGNRVYEDGTVTGKIIKGIGGFYYVAAEDGKVYECKARGAFRKEKLRPLVGDDCELSVLDAEACLGSVDRILARRNELIRPAVANTDQAIVIFAASKPEPGERLIDRYLVGMSYVDMPVILVINKVDAERKRAEELRELYEQVGYRVLLTSAKTGEGVDGLSSLLEGKTSVLSGPSGVGKSSLMNAVFPGFEAKTGSISEKIGRGRHTTRHSELIRVAKATYLCDTPGFSSVELPERMTEETLELCFPEFSEYMGTCRFGTSCRHMAEPDCSVKRAVEEGHIKKSRYESYLGLQEILRSRRKSEWN